MRYVIKISFLILLISLFSCDEIYYVDCDTCFTDEPVDCIVTMYFNDSYGSPLSYDVTVYLGKVEDGIVHESFNVYTSSDATFNALINNEYTVVATTDIGGKNYRVVNSTTPETRLVEGLCTEDCYVVRQNSINMRLKYY